jgi:uncharacterized protein (TIGR03118 family)
MSRFKSMLVVGIVASLGGAIIVAPTASHAFFIKKNLRATDAAYCAAQVDTGIKNAWGIAIRPAGLGGHFWVTGNGTGKSVQYVGDVAGKPLFQDALKLVDVPGPTMAQGTPTGVVFNGSDKFVVTNDHPNGAITAPAKFIFATDNGVISAWTERKRSDGATDWPEKAAAVIDGSAKGQKYFGVGATGDGSKLLVADFGLAPVLRVYDSAFKEITSAEKFANPFAKDGVARPGDYVPFNVQVLNANGAERVFVAYAKSKDDPATPAVDFFAGEEDAGAGNGRLAEFDIDGNLVAKWDDRKLLNAPWGLAIAPQNFGAFSGHLLVSNFGDGTTVAFDLDTRRAVDYVRDPYFLPIKTEGIWGLQFGNGASLGEANHLYFAAGPEDEEAGVFGKIEPLSFRSRDDFNALLRWYREHTVCSHGDSDKEGAKGEWRTCSRKPACNKE